MKYFAQFPSTSLNSFHVLLSDGRQCGDSLPYLKVRPPNVFSLLGCKKYPDFPFSLTEVSGPLPPGYQPSEVEKGWHAWWEENQ